MPPSGCKRRGARILQRIVVLTLSARKSCDVGKCARCLSVLRSPLNRQKARGVSPPGFALVLRMRTDRTPRTIRHDWLMRRDGARSGQNRQPLPARSELARRLFHFFNDGDGRLEHAGDERQACRRVSRGRPSSTGPRIALGAAGFGTVAARRSPASRLARLDERRRDCRCASRAGASAARGMISCWPGVTRDFADR